MLGFHEARLLTADDTPEGEPPVTDDHLLQIDAEPVRLGALALTRIQPPGGKPMDASSWLRGRSGGKR